MADSLAPRSHVPASKEFVAAFIKKHGKPPENHAWIEYISFKVMAQAMNDTKSTDTDKLIAYFEKQTEFDILKGRKGYFRNWDHQLIQEAYPFTVKPKGQAKDKWDFSRSVRPFRARTNRSKSSTRPRNRIPAPCNWAVGRGHAQRRVRSRCTPVLTGTTHR